ncbi:MAG: hypothetical protein IJU76_07145 [Desulfovibrionaceae bacterium]|nr:hypothetical protein [Desulfovibrionaceae bacterium]
MEETKCLEFEEELNALLKDSKKTNSEVRDTLRNLADKYKDKLSLSDCLELTKTFLLIGALTEAEKFCKLVIDRCPPGSLETLKDKYMALVYLSSVASSSANHAISRTIFLKVLSVIPEFLKHLLWHYVYLMSYDPEMNSRKQRVLSELNTRHYVTHHSSRPKATPLNGRPLRIGYVSGDFKIHPVGLLLYGVFAAHDKDKIEAFAYSTLQTDQNSVLDVIKKNSTFHDVSTLDDDEFEEQIRSDKIDILVDLAGYTNGHRLQVFAREPASCMISWLGYWATTGLRSMDSVILDPWHAPENAGYEKAFTEKIYRLPCVRFCFKPAQNTPDISPYPPVLDNGYITFGCFNNTAKYSGLMIRTWAEILKRVKNSRLILKWMTFQDEGMCNRIRKSFQALGVSEDRVELRGWSSYVDMLSEYQDIDIALDTFPFSGGITTCNALWAGVPLVTLEGNYVAGRQGHAILNAIDLPELSAHNIEHYINIACGLAENRVLLTLLHVTMRHRMLNSQFLNIKSFTHYLEDAYLNIYNNMY